MPSLETAAIGMVAISPLERKPSWAAERLAEHEGAAHPTRAPINKRATNYIANPGEAPAKIKHGPLKAISP